MRIVSWNCNGAFRKKFEQILSMNADIYVVQECEDPNSCGNVAYREFSKNSIWTGKNKNKGLGIFLKSSVNYKENYWPDRGLRDFISIRINSQFNLLGVWACDPYIEEYLAYQDVNYELFDENTIIIGDFNSNSIWDHQHGLRNHSSMVRMLEAKNLFSAYHYTRNEEQGKEKEKTIYLHKYPDKAFHIDYCFLAPQRIAIFNILTPQHWLKYSAHMPIVVDVK